MKSIYMTAMIVVGALAVPFRSTAQDTTAPGQGPRYLIVNLPDTLGGTVGAANAINNRGWAMGAATLPGNTTEHATVWIYGKAIDLGTLGGANLSLIHI